VLFPEPEPDGRLACHTQHELDQKKKLVKSNLCQVFGNVYHDILYIKKLNPILLAWLLTSATKTGGLVRFDLVCCCLLRVNGAPRRINSHRGHGVA
jgi:hypothetical protein